MRLKTYAEIIDFCDPALDTLVISGRQILAANDAFMRTVHGQDSSLYTAGRKDAIEVAIVNLCYAFVSRDWQLVGTALAALEVGISQCQARDCERQRRRLAKLCAALQQQLERLAPGDRQQAMQLLRQAAQTPDDPQEAEPGRPPGD